MLCAFISIGPDESDILLSVGLLVAAALLTILAFGQVKSATSHTRMRLIGVFALIGVAAIVWALSEPVSRLVKRSHTAETVASIHKYCLGLSDAELNDFGVRLNTDKWESMPQDGYQRLILRAKKEGKLLVRGGNWLGDEQFLDFWMRPFRIAVDVQEGNRVVIVDSLGPDGRSGTLDDIQCSGSMKTTKR